MTNTPMLKELMTATDYASRQSDRYLFVGAIILLLVGGFFLTRYLFAQWRRTQDNFDATLREITRDQQASMKEWGVIVERNSVALSTASNQIERLRENCALVNRLTERKIHT